MHIPEGFASVEEISHFPSTQITIFCTWEIFHTDLTFNTYGV